MNPDLQQLARETKEACLVRGDAEEMNMTAFHTTHPLREFVAYEEYVNEPDEHLNEIATNRLKTIRFLKPFGLAYKHALRITKSLRLRTPADIVMIMSQADIKSSAKSVAVALKAEVVDQIGFARELHNASIYLKAAANRGEDYSQYLQVSRVPTKEEIQSTIINFEAIESSFKKLGFELKLLHNLKPFDGKEKSWTEWSQDALRVFSQAGCLKVAENEIFARQHPDADKALFHALHRMLKEGLCKSFTRDPKNKDSGNAVWKALLNLFASRASDQNRHAKLHHKLIRMTVTEPSKFLAYLAEVNTIASELETPSSRIRLSDGHVYSYMTLGIQIKNPYFIDLMNRIELKNYELTMAKKEFKWRDAIAYLRERVNRETNSGVHDTDSKPKGERNKGNKSGKSDKPAKENEKTESTSKKPDSETKKKKSKGKTFSDETWSKLPAAARAQFWSKGDFHKTLPTSSKSLLLESEVSKVKKFINAPEGTVFQVKRYRTDSDSKAVKRLRVELGTEADETKGSPTDWKELEPEEI